MGIFSKIKDAIFGKKAEAKETGNVQIGGGSGGFERTQPAPTIGGGSVDVDAVLAAKAAQTDQELNYQTSIVDLMKLLDLDSSYDNRKELAQEMGNSDYSGSAEDNMLLHRLVMLELEKNGGQVSDKLKN
ncbi:DUF3597 domain-containing protein [Sphingomicrobium sediminis]|uniref:DUF3597 domain-containing protein n=1 Tax=Sphingomicrobium sediminis TaxID=2950949 RepID=A0A9X2EKE4_9SPHN|nr:DUF3597 domain-containing protein [Sphingomicrobium sediminis]MCM8556979.1 DUF3597 domain-containing protein [Sphingomicrobium sediminis]